MKKIILLLFLILQLYADNPITYSSLGDVIYDNANKIEKLKDINLYNLKHEMINKYISEVNKVKEYGFLVDEKSSKVSKKEYLQMLREISKKNDLFLIDINKNLMSAIENEESKFFSQLINSNLIDIKTHYKKIKKYYLSHRDTVSISQKLRDDFERDEKSIYNREQKKSKEKRDAERFKSIQEADKARQEAMEKKLEEEAKMKKYEIEQIQKKELSR